MHQGLVLDIRRDAQGDEFLHFPVMFVSDIHLGTKHSRAKRLSHAFQHTITDQLYCVGDIFDGEYMQKKTGWGFADWHRQVVAHACRKAARKSKVTYIPGNHDVGIRNQKVMRDGEEQSHRNLCGKTICGINIEEKAYYADPNGHVIKVIHGDQYDLTLGSLGGLGNAALEVVARIDTWFQHLPRCGHISLAAKGKRFVKKTVDRFWSIRKNIAKDVDKDQSICGIVTGHSHMSEISRTPHGKLLLNDGCCTEHVEFLVQDKNGAWAILEWHQSHLKITQEAEKKNGEPRQRIVSWEELGLRSFNEPPALIEDEDTEKADRIIWLLYRMWPPQERREMAKAAKFASAADETFLSIVSIPLPKPRRERGLFESTSSPWNVRPIEDRVLVA